MIVITHSQTSYDNAIKTNNRQDTPETTKETEVSQTAARLAEATYYSMPELGSKGDRGYAASIVTFNSYTEPLKSGARCGNTCATARTDWDGYSKEKPESFSHVPDKLWEAMVNSYNDGERIDFATLFDVPKWEVGFHKEPPVLNKFEVDDEKMLSYDYLSIIDLKIQTSGYTLPDNASEEQLIEATETYKDYLKQLHTLRENIAEVLEYPLRSESESDYNTFNTLYVDGGDQDLKDTFIASIRGYEQKLNWQVVKETVKEKGLFNEYFPQIRAELNEHSEEENSIRNEFKNYLLKQNSNLFDDLEVSPEINEEWYSKVLAQHVSKVIESMGPLGSPDSKWEVPILWEIQQQKNNIKDAS